jgi:leader peptidase (prepilin peptidase)/N-methyltransferase
LKWYDLIPVFSWFSLGGKCRKCQKPIGYLEPILEIVMAIFFVLSFILWPIPLDTIMTIFQFIIWLIAGVILAIIFVYDMKWLEIPTVLNYLFIALGFLYSIITLLSSQDFYNRVFSLAISILILSGLYLFIYLVSKKRWIGFGDVLLGLGMAFFLVDWELAYIALFSANLIGCLVILPGMLSGKLKRTSKIPFGPFLILGLVIAKLLGYQIVQMVFFSYL